MSKPESTERTPQEETEHPPGEQEMQSPDQVAGDDRSDYGGAAGQDDDRDERSNRPPSEQDEDQGI
jgi:hypothetical protein